MIKRPIKKPIIVPVEASKTLGFEYQIRFSNRKTAAIEIKRNTVTVAAPFGTPQKGLHQWVIQKKHWIAEKLNQQNIRRSEIPKPSFQCGESWLFMGRKLTLKVIYRSRSHAFIEADTLHLPVATSIEKTQPEAIRRRLIKWYTLQAEEYMGPKTIRVAKDINKSVTDITFRRTKSKWGHCTNRGVIQYNWLIMMAPKPIIDYLISHEVSHLVHPNHSSKFWKQVAKITPNYLEERHWLKENGHKLEI